MKTLVQMNYCLSGWIANLGVVPLFLFSAFLFLPIFLSFILLLHLVCIVLDAIIISLSNKFLNANKFRQVVLLSLLFIVKGFVTPFALSQTIEDDHSKRFDERFENQIFLARGEQKEIKINDLDSYSTGNPEVISVKYRAKKKLMLIKGRSIGFSDLLIWRRNKRQNYKIFVISKREQLKRLSIVGDLRRIGLKGELKSGVVYVSGIVEKLSQYLHVKNLKKTQPEIIWQIRIKQHLRNEIIADIYKTVYGHDVSFIKCEELDLVFNCHYQGIIQPFHREYLKSKYIINLLASKESKHHNYFLEFKIIQIEHIETKSMTIGLDKISNSIEGLLNFNDFINKKTILLEGQKIYATLIANPKAVITLEAPTIISLGSEIPFSQTSNNGVNTQWKFAGLKIRSSLQKQSDKILLNYETDFTRSAGDSIGGSAGKGSLYILPNKFIRIFEITFETNQRNRSYLPGLGEVPILRYFFQGGHKSNGHKQIIGFLKVTQGNTDGNQ